MISRFDRLPPRRSALSIVAFLCLACLGLTRGQDPIPFAQDGDEEPATARTFLSIYEVADLVGLTSFESPPLGLTLPDDEERRQESEIRGKLVVERRISELAKLLSEETVEKADGEVRIEATGTRQLLVDAPPAVHERVTRILSRLRGGDAQEVVTLEFRLVRLSKEGIERLPEDLARVVRFAAFSRASQGAGTLTAQQVESLTAAQSDGCAPVLTCFNRQRASIIVMTQRATIAGVRPVVRGGRAVAEPQIGVLSTGVTAEVEPSVSDSGTDVALGLAVETARETGPSDSILAKDLPEYADLEGAEELPLERPNVVYSRLKSTVHLAKDRWTLVGATTPNDAGAESDESYLVLVKTSVRSPSKSEATGGEK